MGGGGSSGRGMGGSGNTTERNGSGRAFPTMARPPAGVNEKPESADPPTRPAACGRRRLNLFRAASGFAGNARLPHAPFFGLPLGRRGAGGSSAVAFFGRPRFGSGAGPGAARNARRSTPRASAKATAVGHV